MSTLITARSEDRPAVYDFQAFVDRVAAFAAPGCGTFSELVDALPGVLPDDALASLRRLSQSSGNSEHLDRLAADATCDRAPTILHQGRGLPLPHPLDSEFRFDEATAAQLAERLVTATRDGDEILLDPPWYEGPVQTMLGICARCCSIGAPVWMVLPPVGTKAQAAHDREAFIGIARRHGLLPISMTGTATYRTPLFELAALERQRIARLGSWRRGDLVQLVVQDAPRPPGEVPVGYAGPQRVSVLY